jgi:hypothetical protein
MASRARAEGWTACSTEVIELFCRLGAAGRLVQLAESFNLFTKTVPEAGPFLFDVIPIILRLEYPPLATLARTMPLKFADTVFEELDMLPTALGDPQDFERAADQAVERLRRLQTR